MLGDELGMPSIKKPCADFLAKTGIAEAQATESWARLLQVRPHLAGEVTHGDRWVHGVLAEGGPRTVALVARLGSTSEAARSSQRLFRFWRRWCRRRGSGRPQLRKSTSMP